MIELFITVILVGFFGLFMLMAIPLKDQANKLNTQMDNKHNPSNLQS